MKEAIGGSWLFVIVILFLTLFSGFVALAVNYSRCYKTKDEILQIIEDKNGLNKEAITEINKTLKNIGYSSKGKCPSDSNCWYAFSVTKDDGTVSYSQTTNYCISKTVLSQNSINKVDDKNSSYVSEVGTLGHPNSSYYSVVAFFGLDLPAIFGNFHISIQGETEPIFMAKDFSFVGNTSDPKCSTN